MPSVTAQCRVVSLVNVASLAAAQVQIDAGVAAAVLAGFIPESFAPLPAIPVSAAEGRVNGLLLEGASVPSWGGTTRAECVLLKVSSRSDAAAIEAAIAAEIAAQDLAGLTPALRQMAFFSLTIGDAPIDVAALLFTNGANTTAPATEFSPGTMSAADKLKLDNIQNQGPTTFPSQVSAGVFYVDWSLSGTYYVQLVAAAACQIGFSSMADGELVVLLVDNNAAASLAFLSTILWPGGTVPTPTLGGRDVYTFVAFGSIIIGSAILDVK